MIEIKVSIVLVSFKSARLAIDCMRSVAAERSAPGLQIRAFVVDNASGDYPVICEAVARNGWGSWVSVLLAPRNGGFAYGNNIGIRRSLESVASDYVLLLNPDTEVRPGAIEALVRFLEANPQVGIAGSSFENLDGSDWPIAFRFPNLVSEVCSALDLGPITRLFGRWQVARQMPRSTQMVDWICGASMMIRPTVFEAIGGFDESYFLYFEETDFCLRARRAGFSTWYVPESRVMHIAGQSTGVTERNVHARRLPDYWFESRRRYFAVAFGIVQAMAIDVLVLLTYPFGWLKRLILRRLSQSVPCYWQDLARSSVLWRRNRTLSPARAAIHSAGDPHRA